MNELTQMKLLRESITRIEEGKHVVTITSYQLDNIDREEPTDYPIDSETVETNASSIEEFLLGMLKNDGLSDDEARAELAGFEQWADGGMYREEDHGEGYVLVGYVFK